MKIGRIVLLVSVIAFVNSCKVQYSKDLSLRIEYLQEENCNYFCNTAQLYVKNNTSDKIYFPAIGIPLRNRKGVYINYDKYLYKLKRYEDKARIEGITFDGKQFNQHYIDFSSSNSPKGFFEDIKKKELKKHYQYNNIDNANDYLKKEIEDWIKLKYESIQFIFLEPNEECMIDVAIIDPIFKEKKTLKLSLLYDPCQINEKRWFNPIYADSISLYHGYLEEIAGYKLYSGLTKSNTLIIKKGSLVKEKPANSGGLDRMKFLNKLALSTRRPRK